MVRLHGYAERLSSDLYDCIFTALDRDEMSIMEMLKPGLLSMFGNRHVGQDLYTNLQTVHDLGGNTTYTICNWYARTNIQPCKEWSDFANATILTLYIGTKTMWKARLAQLLEREQDQSISVLDMAKMLYRAAERDPGKKFDDLSKADQSRWMEDAAHILPDKMWRIACHIPTRQSFRVDVKTFPGALDALLAAASRPEWKAPVPRAMCWVHLPGMTTRHVD